jgi:hypothetical protein
LIAHGADGRDRVQAYDIIVLVHDQTRINAATTKLAQEKPAVEPIVQLSGQAA